MQRDNRQVALTIYSAFQVRDEVQDTGVGIAPDLTVYNVPMFQMRLFNLNKRHIIKESPTSASGNDL